MAENIVKYAILSATDRLVSKKCTEIVYTFYPQAVVAKSIVKSDILLATVRLVAKKYTGI